MAKRKRNSKGTYTNKRRKRNVSRGETIRASVLSNGVRGRISKNSSIHKRTYRGRRKKPSKGLKRARRGQVGNKPSTIITSQMMNYKVLPNQKGILGNIARKIGIMDPYTTLPGTNIHELSGGYQVPDANFDEFVADQYKTYETMLGDTDESNVLTSHRMDWTMFTNDEWRDNLCYLLGLFQNTGSLGGGGDVQPTTANPTSGLTIPSDINAVTPFLTTPFMTGANGTAMWGYAPPNSFELQDTGGTSYPTPFGSPVPLIGAANTTVATHQSNNNQPGWAAQQHYVLSESLTWYVHNQGSTDMTVILNECTLKYDIPIINGLSEIKRADGSVIRLQSAYGGMIDPLEQWRNSRTKQSYADKNNLELPIAKSSIDARDYWQGYSPNRDRLNNDIYDYASNTKYADRLNAVYNVKKHFQTIRPGQTAHFKVKVDFNHKVSPHQITNLYAIGGKSKTFFFEFLTRPVAAGNVTNSLSGAGNSVITGRGLGRPPADVSIKWTKTKRFLLDQVMRTNTLNIRGARPKYNYFGVIEPDGDRKVILTNAANDNVLDPEAVNNDAMQMVAGAMGGLIDININDINIF